MIDDALGYWFAGFTDGEGCFTVTVKQAQGSRNGGQHGCRFVIALRDDDAPLLRELHERIGAGYLTRSGSNAGKNPQLRWIVSSKQGCAVLVSIFDRYPLRSKKAADYRVWREAVCAWVAMRGQGRTRNDWSDLARLKGELEDVRRYRVMDAARR